VTKTDFLYLIIYSLFFTQAFSQNLQLSVEGISANETSVIDSLSYSKSFADISSLIAERDSLQNRLYRRGYIENQILSFKKTNDSIYKTLISLNTLYKTITISYQNVSKDILESVSSIVTETHFTLPFLEIESKLNFINQQLANQGSPFKSIQLSQIEKKDDNTLKAILVVSDDSFRSINRIVVNGYEKFPKSYLKRFLKINTGDEFNLETIRTKTKSLDELTFAGQIKDPEVLFTKDSTALYLYLEKKPSNTFDGFLGFGTNERTNKIEFDGYLNLNLVNNLNYGESFRLLYKSDENDQRTFQGTISLPYILGSPIGIEAQINIFRKDSSFTTVNQYAKLAYQINSKSKVLAGIQTTQSSNLLETSSVLLIDDYDSSFINLGYNYLSYQDNNLFPINFLFEAETGIGKRKTTSQDIKQNNVSFNAFKIFNLNPKNSIYTRLNGSFLFSDNFFFNELYRFGGINSIRGFEENSLFASAFTVLNTEYRYQLSSSIYVNTIIDAAYYENDLSDIKDRLFGFGFGFGLLTNSGLLKFNYANGKTEGQKFKFSDSKIHLSLTAKF